MCMGMRTCVYMFVRMLMGMCVGGMLAGVRGHVNVCGGVCG